MKWKKKFITCSLLAGPMVLTNSEARAQPSLQLIAQKTLGFPAASGIECYRDKLYIFGDNATHLLILSADYGQADSIAYWQSIENIIDRSDKPDIESAMVAQKGDDVVLYGVGSMSDKKRWRVYAFSLNDRKVKTMQFFEKEQTFPGIVELNIEGSTEVGNTVLLCNRANEKTKRNHLLFWNWKDSVATKEMILPAAKVTAGLSGLHYVKEKDLLLFTASEEDTNNAVKDGQIGDSFLGWIGDFSKKLKQSSFSPDGYLKLSSFDKAFAKQKVESVSVEKVSGDDLVLHLVADNDDGQSKIFKVRLRLREP